MAVIGHNFFKIEAERKARGKVKLGRIDNNVKIKDVERRNVRPSNSEVAVFRYVFKTDYKLEEPEGEELAEIEIGGEVIWKNGVDKIMDEWQEKQKIPEEIFKEVLNAALSKAQVKLLEVTQDLNLPIPIQLPSIKKEDNEPKQQEDRMSYIR